MGRVLGLDYGTRRVGVAASDALRITAQPHSVIDLERVDLSAALEELVRELEPELIVIGLPVGLNGREGQMAEAARRFGAEVRDASDLPVEFFDERFTSASAERVLLGARVRRRKRRRVRDKVAAAVMLQSYLDRQ